MGFDDGPLAAAVPAHKVRQPVEQTVRAARTSRPLSMTWLPVCGMWGEVIGPGGHHDRYRRDDLSAT
jgi:hypothetical protein